MLEKMTNLVDEYGYPDKLRAEAPNQKKRWGREIHEGHQPRRNTDYDFPQGWGKLSDEEKNTWFIRQRTYRQAWRQWDNGAMMQGFSEAELQGGAAPIEGVAAVKDNPFKL
jgi:hypothetical protein